MGVAEPPPWPLEVVQPTPRALGLARPPLFGLVCVRPPQTGRFGGSRTTPVAHGGCLATPTRPKRERERERERERVYSLFGNKRE
jgi:hypothetical protein